MEIIQFFIDLLSDPRMAIAGWIAALGPIWVYSPLFLIVFCETGLVFTPFLPGDSLLFAAGVFCADGGGLNVIATLLMFYAAAILGNTSNYFIGRAFGNAIISSGKVKALTPERIEKTEGFFEKWGGLT
ncbi:MAG: DedA family protein, partial [Raoultibacter sp.]